MHLETIWSLCTSQGHSLRIMHRDMPVADAEDAARQLSMVGDMILLPGGALLHRKTKDDLSIVNPADVIIEVYTRPMEMRGEPFIPDMTTPEGRARIKAMLTDPRYHAREDEFAVENISLAELAMIPGATGALESTAYDMR